MSAHLVDVQIGRFVIDQRLDTILPEGESRTEDHVLIPRDYQDPRTARESLAERR